ncbi:MAG: hypothetical protein AAFP99_04365 [Pseudomonadota bacterium]
MLMSLDTQSWLFLMFFLSAAGFFLGSALHGVMEDDGFGPVGNMTMLVIGALCAGVGVDFTDYRVNDPTTLAVIMICGGFACLTLMAISKAIFYRLGA